MAAHAESGGWCLVSAERTKAVLVLGVAGILLGAIAIWWCVRRLLTRR
jgi:hypothetical protein